jgi:diguanylate cyclase (GGDEF)-like protein
MTPKNQAPASMCGQAGLNELAQPVSQVDHWEWCPQPRRLLVSSGLARLLEVPGEACPDSLSGLMRFTHPDDLGLVEQTITVVGAFGKAQELDYRLKLQSGRVIRVASTIMPAPGRAPGCVIGVLRYEAEAPIGPAVSGGRDSLTGLLTRGAFAARLGVMLAQQDPERARFAIVLLNVNQFKRVNAGFGPEIGDALLKSIAKRLYRLSREAEIPARLGGDEFAVVLADSGSEALSEQVAALALEMREPFSLGGQAVHVAINVGYSLYPSHGVDAVDLIRKAEISLHQAKADGCHVVAEYKLGSSERAEERIYLEAGLRQALQHQELELYYQPQVCMATGRIIGAEALMRWHHPELGLIPPDKFIPLAEESGLILDLGEWALYTVAKQAQEWKNLGAGFQRVAVNVSSIQLNRSNLLAIVNRVLAVSAIDPALLELELTESVVMHSDSSAAATLVQLHDRGISIAVDDFGTGYSSLAYLQKLPINKLKLDKSFIKNIVSNPDDLAIARAIVSLGKSLRLTVIAEGVETQGQRVILEQEGCEQAQGFLYGYPMPAASLTALLKDSLNLQLSPGGASV